MRLELTGRHLDITPGLRRLVEGKLTKLDRLLNDAAVSAQAVLSRERGRTRVDVTLHARGEKFLHGFGVAATWEPAIGAAVQKISRQALKLKEKYSGRKREPVPAGLAVERAEPAALKRTAASAGRDGKSPAARPRRASGASLRVVRTDLRPIKPMTLADAAREQDAASDSVVVFRDRETGAISVLYRRRGELTLVKTEA